LARCCSVGPFWLFVSGTFMPSPLFQVVFTSDRYDLEVERAMIEAAADLEIELRGRLCSSPQELAEFARQADALLISSRETIDRELISQLDKCKVISRYAVGVDQVDLEAATERGIVVAHVPDYCTAEVADHSLAMILALNRRIVEIDRDLHQGAWVQHSYHTRKMLRGPIRPMRELTLGLIGLGRIGSAVARRALPLGVRIVAHDPYIPRDLIRELGAEPISLADLASTSDIVSIHCPLTSETRGLVDRSLIAQMKPTAVLVNTARGKIVDLEALADALAAGRLAGAALDVVDPEPLPLESPLYQLPNVILTPHAAYYSERSVELVREEAIDSVLRVLRGELPRTVANPAVIDRLRLAPYTGR
jgi:D-3-phosphoglycerate dehydrogenase / 2-oxoglutarate reductase